MHNLNSLILLRVFSNSHKTLSNNQFLVVYLVNLLLVSLDSLNSRINPPPSQWVLSVSIILDLLFSLVNRIVIWNSPINLTLITICKSIWRSWNSIKLITIEQSIIINLITTILIITLITWISTLINTFCNISFLITIITIRI